MRLPESDTSRQVMEAGPGAAGTSVAVVVPLMLLQACEKPRVPLALASAEPCLEVHDMFQNVLELHLHLLGKDVPVSLQVPISAPQQPQGNSFGLPACCQQRWPDTSTGLPCSSGVTEMWQSEEKVSSWI